MLGYYLRLALRSLGKNPILTALMIAAIVLFLVAWLGTVYRIATPSKGE